MAMAGNAEDLLLEGGLLVATTVGLIVAGVWKLSGVRDEIRKELGDEMSELTKQVTETLMAMREKIVQVEFYVRDNYVSKDTFNVVTERILAELRSVGDKFDSRCTSMETKIMTYLYEARQNHEPP